MPPTPTAPDETVSTTAEPPTIIAAIYRIAVNEVVPGVNWRGRHLGDLTGLQQSIAHSGQKDPITVTRLPDGRYEIIDGERRWAAIRRLGLTHITATLAPPLTGAERAARQVAWHIHRHRFNPLAEAHALRHLLHVERLTITQIATALGTTPAWVKNRVALLQLRSTEQDLLLAGQMTIGDAVRIVLARRGLRRDHRPALASETPPPARRHYRYWNMGNPLASAAIAACVAAGHRHRAPTTAWGAVACGASWEQVIRLDERQRALATPQPDTASAPVALSLRETHALRLIAAGMSQTETARRMGFSKPFLQKRVLQPMVARLGVGTTMEAVAWAVRQNLLPAPPAPAPTAAPHTLDEQETTILRHAAAGLTNEQIATAMNVTLRTVINRWNALHHRTGFHTRYQSVAWAIHAGHI